MRGEKNEKKIPASFCSLQDVKCVIGNSQWTSDNTKDVFNHPHQNPHPHNTPPGSERVPGTFISGS